MWVFWQLSTSLTCTFICIESSGERVNTTMTGKGYYWKSLAGALHSCNYWVMAILAQTHEQLCCSLSSSDNKVGLFRYRPAFPNPKWGVKKRNPKHCLLTISTWHLATAVWLSSIAIWRRRNVRNWALALGMYTHIKTVTR